MICVCDHAAPGLGTALITQAYVLYRLGRLPDAVKSLAEVEPERRSEALQLEAQLHYRLGDAGKCIAAYDALAKEFKVRMRPHAAAARSHAAAARAHAAAARAYAAAARAHAAAGGRMLQLPAAQPRARLRATA